MKPMIDTPSSSAAADRGIRAPMPAVLSCPPWTSYVRGLFVLLLAGGMGVARGGPAEAQSVNIQGGIADGKARLLIEALLKEHGEDRLKVFHTTSINHHLRVQSDQIEHALDLKFEVLQGEAREVQLALKGEGEVVSVSGEAIQDWSVRREPGGSAWLVLRTRKRDKPWDQFQASVVALTKLSGLPATVSPLVVHGAVAALGSGMIRVTDTPEMSAEVVESAGLVSLPGGAAQGNRGTAGQAGTDGSAAYRIQGEPYRFTLKCSLSDPESRTVVLRGFELRGDLGDGRAGFELVGTARVGNPRGGTMRLLSGGAALSESQDTGDARLEFSEGAYRLKFDRPGDYSLRVRFNAQVARSNDWQTVRFQVAQGALQPVVLKGLSPEAEVEFAGSARAVRSGTEARAHLPSDGTVQFAWKKARPELESKLFYSAEMQMNVVVAQGLVKQAALLQGRVMQGELGQLVLRLSGAGDLTRVQGAQILSWQVAPAGGGSADRLLTLRFNQAVKEHFVVQIHSQTDLGALPAQASLLQLAPEAATRFAGHIRVVNEGVVRLEVLSSRGLSQVSPEQFPENDQTRSVFPAPGPQRFVFRFSTADFGLTLRADTILPELGVSQVLVYHAGENETWIEAEFDVEVREAPIRELLLRVPQGYALAKVSAQGMSDYVLGSSEDQPELRLVYGQPVLGRQLVQLRLERNAALGASAWTLPRLEVPRAKSVRGAVIVSSDMGFRVNAGRISGLVELATAFAPKKVVGIQAAFRLVEPSWAAEVMIERLPQTIQAEAFHLFSIGEGLAYGGSTIQYSIAGAPKGVFLVELSEEYANVEFTGKDVRGWQKTPEGYRVQLHNPVAGSFTMLATYERAFKPQGATLAFTGARPLEVQSEQGHTVVVSAYQFAVKPVNVSPGLIALEPAEVPSEFRLLFDSPVLAAYRYAARPFQLQLELSPLAQGESLSLVADRASFSTRISKDGEILTTARYFLKNRGHTHLRLELPSGSELWSATIDGVTAAPIKDGASSLLPLPKQPDPNTVQSLELKLASRASTERYLRAALPVLSCPVLLGDWSIAADSGRQLVYRTGSLVPSGGIPDPSSFATLGRAWRDARSSLGLLALIASGLVLLGLAATRWASGSEAARNKAVSWLARWVGLLSLVLALAALIPIMETVGRHRIGDVSVLRFVAPVQQAGSSLAVELGNLPSGVSWGGRFSSLIPAAFAIGLWLLSVREAWTWLRPVLGPIGWTLLAWSTLKMPGAGEWFFGLLAVFLLFRVCGPGVLRLWRAKGLGGTTGGGSTSAPVVAALLVGIIGMGQQAQAQASSQQRSVNEPVLTGETVSKTASRKSVADWIEQEVRIEDRHVQAQVILKWRALKGQSIPVLAGTAVLTSLEAPTNAVQWVLDEAAPGSVHRLWALKDGAVEVRFSYQTESQLHGGIPGFVSPVFHGLVNRWSLTVRGAEVEVHSPQSVAHESLTREGHTHAKLVTLPLDRALVTWRPRSRDTRSEKASFFVESAHLYAPAAGVVDGLHRVQIRPVQGELGELALEVPEAMAIADVTDGALKPGPAEVGTRARTASPAPLLASWSFAPDSRVLKIQMATPQSRPFQLVIRSQSAASPLPFTRKLGMIYVKGAEGHVGLAGLATGEEVQLDRVDPSGMSAISLEDFPGAPMGILSQTHPGLTLRRAFRAGTREGMLEVRASAVEPDVRVESQQTISVGEDRLVLAANLVVSVARSGVFRFSFTLPNGLEVESLSGNGMSHWTELARPEGRVVTMHLPGKTLGETRFAITLAGAGLKGVPRWTVPRLELREASKQRGQLIIVPEQGLRVQVGNRENVTQLDPQKAGIHQKGVLAFRILQEQWVLSLDLAQVESWVQATSLQHVTVGPAQVRTGVNLQYQIENTGLKALRVRIPTNAESLRFKGDQVADFVALGDADENGLRTWEVKLHRRVLGRYLLQASFQTGLSSEAQDFTIQGVQAVDAGLQRGFVSLEATGRTQVRPGTVPDGLQASEWQSVPRTLQQDVVTASASHTFRLVDASWQLPLKIERHEAAKLLPARVQSVTLRSVISDEGVMLTEARLELFPGDKRLLQIALPAEAKFWYALVNQNGVWPWKEGDKTLIPLEAAKSGAVSVVEIYYSSRIGSPHTRRLDLALQGPRFDLPLENIAWQVRLNPKWRLDSWKGTLELREESSLPVEPFDLGGYLSRESKARAERSKAAEEFLNFGNQLLETGDPQQARRAFQNAFGLSRHDHAFNEDARVQLHNLKLQQAMVGLNVLNNRQPARGETPAAKQATAVAGRAGAYTQAEAKELLDANTAEDNASMTKLAERLIQQQDAAVPAPAAIRATLPDQGKQLTFTRAVLVDTFADLSLRLRASSSAPASSGARFALLGLLLLLFGVLGLGSRWAARS